MKKTMMKVALCMAIGFSIVGCSMSKNEFEIGLPSEVETSVDGVLFVPENGSLSNTGVTIRIGNLGEIPLSYGEDYELEIKQNGVWHKINVEILFTMQAYILNPEETSTSININWENTYGKLAKGEYRFLKNITFDNGEHIVVSFEFEIK